VLQVKLIAGGSIGLAVVSWLIVVVAIFSVSAIPVPVRLLLLALLFALFGSTEWLLWTVLKPPVLRADAIELSSGPWIERQRMQRSEVAFIFRGQVAGKGRTRGTFYKSYVLAAADGTVGMSVSALVFTPDGTAQFAQRLQVPIRGDFSARVKDRVDPTTA
jgi:hypothetical protein